MADENKGDRKLHLHRTEDDFALPRSVICQWDANTTLEDVKAMVAAKAQCSLEAVVIKMKWPKVPGGVKSPLSTSRISEWMVLDENHHGTFSIARPCVICKSLPPLEPWTLHCRHVVCRDCIVDETGATRHPHCPACDSTIMPFMGTVTVQSVLRGCEKCGINYGLCWSICQMCKIPTSDRTVVATSLLEFVPQPDGATFFRGYIRCDKCVPKVNEAQRRKMNSTLRHHDGKCFHVVQREFVLPDALRELQDWGENADVLALLPCENIQLTIDVPHYSE